MAGLIEDWICPNCNSKVKENKFCCCGAMYASHLHMIVFSFTEGLYIIWQPDNQKCFIHHGYDEYEVPYSFSSLKLNNLKAFL